jgi:hypothetical protein
VWDPLSSWHGVQVHILQFYRLVCIVLDHFNPKSTCYSVLLSQQNQRWWFFKVFFLISKVSSFPRSMCFLAIFKTSYAFTRCELIERIFAKHEVLPRVAGLGRTCSNAENQAETSSCSLLNSSCSRSSLIITVHYKRLPKPSENISTYASFFII